MKLRIFHTVNAGLYLWNGKSGLLVDVLHGGKEIGFSNMPEGYLDMMEKRLGFWGQRNDLLFTHAHPDHYDPELVQRFFQLYPDRFIYGPGMERSNVDLVEEAGQYEAFWIRDYRICAFATRHDGEAYAGVPHRSFLIQSGKQRIWISGDALLEPELAEPVNRIVGKEKIDAAFVMMYQIGNRQGKEFLRKLAPEQRFLYHLPYREDDRFHCHRMAEGLAGRCAREGMPVILLRPDSFVEGW